MGEASARKLVYARSGRVCERCSSARATEWQHRKNRSQGGLWEASNGLHLCTSCHRYVTDHPAESTAKGWTVPSWCTPAAVPALVNGHFRYLTDDGAVVHEPPMEVA